VGNVKLTELVNKDFMFEIARGNIAGIESVNKFGRNPLATTTLLPVTAGGIFNTPQSSSATALRVKAGNANDTAGGSGARLVTVEGLDENFDKVSANLVTAGASAGAASSVLFARQNRIYVSESGTYATTSAGSHAANVVIENGSGGTDWGTILLGSYPEGQSQIACYSVARNYTAYIPYVSISVDSNKTGYVAGFYRANIDDTSAPYSAMRQFIKLDGVSGPAPLDPTLVYGPFVGPCDIIFMGNMSTGTGEIDVDFGIIECQTT
jgi:hypothetical protein